MKRFYYAILLLCITVTTFNCQKEISRSGPDIPGTGNNSNPDPITTTLQGNIFDENGRAAAGVTVKAGNLTATTNVRGYFRLSNITLDKNSSLVTAEKDGYFKAYRVFGATSGVNQVVINLIKKTSAGTVNTTSGGAVTLSNGSKIALPANGIVKSSGGAYSGIVNVFASYIDPSSPDIGDRVPGSFLADDKNNNRVLLSSYGMLAVELESPSGEKLQIATGKTATLTTSIPASLQSSAPSTISLWYVDEQTGIWKEEGSAVKTGNSYVGDVKHFTYWNCDLSGPTITLRALFKTSDGLPLGNTQIRVRPVNSSSSAHGYTDSLGQINNPVPANQNLVLEVLSPCYTVMYSQNIGPFSSNTDLGTIIVNNSPSIVTIQGRLLNCSGSPVTNGYVVINYSNFVRYAQVQNNNGEFATTISTCGGMPATCEVYGVDATAQQQGATVNVTVSSPITNTGDLTACGTSTLQYINYTVDGVSHGVSSLTLGDALYAAYYDSTNNTHGLHLYGSHSNSIDISFDFEHDQAPGSYPLKFLFTSVTGNTTATPPVMAILTNYAAASGQYFEGTFTGDVKDASNVTHTISCTFRVRRL